MKKNILYQVKNHLLLTVLIFYVVTPTDAQSFKFKAGLPTVDSSSFYKVEIPPAIAGKSQTGLSDIRIVDKNGRENPYLVKSSESSFTETNFEELNIISSSKGADNQTHIVIENAGKRNIDNLLLFIKNTVAQRTITLSGGEDTTGWYVVKEDLVLENFSNSTTQGSFVQAINFPPVDYRYLKLTILGKNVLPVNIVRVGVSSEKYTDGKYILLPAPVITTNDSSDKRTYVHIRFNDIYNVDKLELTVGGLKFYKRNVSFYSGNTTETMPSQFTIASNTPASFPLQVKTREILMVIENEDNPQLKIAFASGSQLNKYLLTFLEKGETYSLLFGDPNASAPAYDLAFFADSIPQVLPVINPLKVEMNPASNTPAKTEKAGRPILLWLVIIAVLGLLLFLCYKMISDLEKKKHEQKI